MSREGEKHLKEEKSGVSEYFLKEEKRLLQGGCKSKQRRPWSKNIRIAQK